MDKSIANVFCFSAFANRNSGVVYTNLTGNFPFLSYNGNVCFLVGDPESQNLSQVGWDYEANAIMVMPVAGLDNITIINAYKATFDELTAKGASN
jgi:hypothetical protein